MLAGWMATQRALVIRATEQGKVLKFFEQLGLEFVPEKHGNGPLHYACERNGVVLEIYQSTKNDRFSLHDFLTPNSEQSSPDSGGS